MRQQKGGPVVGVDIGGTFTDLVSVRDGRLTVHKVSSTPARPDEGLAHGLGELVGKESREGIALVHGTTVGTNAFLERKGAPTALLTTAGFEDILLIGRQTRERLYDLVQPPVVPLVPRHMTFGVAERVGADGSVLEALDVETVAAARAFVERLGSPSVAVCLLFSFINPQHERLLLQALPDASLSSDVLPEYREYERCVATVLNAYLSPIMRAYLDRLESRVRNLGVEHLWVMGADGGLMDPQRAGRRSIRTVLSGPAGGVEGAFAVASRAGFRHIMTLDVGGTSSDVALCPGHVARTRDASLSGLPLAFPIVDIHTVGAGGGSVAWLDAGGALHVGPESAGADPGPACYGRGERPTVTDAHLVLGRLGEDDLLGGRLHLDKARAENAIRSISSSIGCSIGEAAEGLIQVANVTMEKALRVISVERGHDPRRFTLVAFGGAGPLHGCELAEALEMPRVLVPPHPGVLSALGLLLSRQRREQSRTVALRASTTSRNDLHDVLNRLVDEVREGLPGRKTDWKVLPGVDVRYPGQAYELTLHLPQLDPALLQDRFHRLHQQRYGYSRPASDIEIVNVRATLEAAGPATRVAWEASNGHGAAASIRSRPLCYRGEVITCPVYPRHALPGTVYGPAVILQFDATTFLPPGWSAAHDAQNNLILSHEVRR